ncbi:BatD family protein [Mangrovibacterium diazotrophicum]|uniref:Oxygen tolerance protein BatD n=1 Tax=Mangrovibacterium diazotrophicum TaxID=1261403 RepID=A0A419W569_9BACT|nr:BatD family protein [Mangrovibacterium diazotrophicum]RKD90594.1 oxygen tolerance protein BatD [Mangrovibacterium diazotrophicum]
MIKRLILSILFVLPAWFASADSVRFNMTGPNVVSVGEQFRLSFTLNEQGTDLKLPDLSGFDVLMGPSTSQSTSIQMINGQTTQTVSFSYIYILRAKTEGTFTIRPASINVDGKVYESNELEIEVVKGQPQTQQSQSSGSQQQQQQAPATTEITKDDLFVKVDLDKSNVYKGQQIIATVKIYVSPSVPITNFEDVKLPSYEGFWTQDIDIPNQITFNREVYKGKIYQVGVLKKTILFPQQTGKIKIDPFEITCLVRQQIKRQRSFFDDFFDNYRTVSAKVTSDPVYVQVKNLPASPDGFYGGVGDLDFSASIDKTGAKTNEAITLKLTVSGSGNLRLIEAPKVDFPKDFEVYDPKTNESLKSTNSGLQGSKTFEYLVIPRYAGDYTIPAVTFSSFNPATGTYKTTTSKAFDLTIEQGTDDQNTTVTSAYNKEDVRFLGKDIRYIKQNQYKLRSTDNSFYGSLAFWLLYICSFVVAVIVAIVYRKKLKENANIQLVKTKQANKMARKRLKEAAAHLKQHNSEQFYEAVLKAFWGYLSDKLSIPVAKLNRDNAAMTLAQRGASKEQVDEFIKIIDTCEFARYAPSASDAALEEVYEKSANLMGKLDKQIR